MLSKAVIRFSGVKGGIISSDGGYIIAPPGAEWSAFAMDIKTKNVTITGFGILFCKTDFQLRLIQKVLGIIGWKELLFGKPNKGSV
jgi:hypothetical protein